MFLQNKNKIAPSHHPFGKKLPKIRELSDFNKIFSVDLAMNEFCKASVILNQNFLIFFRSRPPPPYFGAQNIGGVVYF